jgi:hypothetical protein
MAGRVRRDTNFFAVRCQASVAHIRQSWPDSGLVFQAKVLETFPVVSSSLGSGNKTIGMIGVVSTVTHGPGKGSFRVIPLRGRVVREQLERFKRLSCWNWLKPTGARIGPGLAYVFQVCTEVIYHTDVQPLHSRRV